MYSIFQVAVFPIYFFTRLLDWLSTVSFFGGIKNITHDFAAFTTNTLQKMVGRRTRKNRGKRTLGVFDQLFFIIALYASIMTVVLFTPIPRIQLPTPIMAFIILYFSSLLALVQTSIFIQMRDKTSKRLHASIIGG